MRPDVRVAIVEDQRSLREGLVILIGSTEGFALVGAFGSMEEALPRIEDDPPDVLLADIGLPGMSGTEGVRQLRSRFPALQILMLTVYADDDHVFEAICAGACGYLLKDTPPAKLRPMRWARTRCGRNRSASSRSAASKRPRPGARPMLSVVAIWPSRCRRTKSWAL